MAAPEIGRACRAWRGPSLKILVTVIRHRPGAVRVTRARPRPPLRARAVGSGQSPVHSQCSGGTAEGSDPPEGDASRGGVTYVAPLVSEEGRRLRSRLCLPPTEQCLTGGTAQRDARRRKFVVAHFVGTLPRKMVRHIASGGDSRDVSRFRYSQVVALANHSLGRPRVCGRKGEAIAGHNRVLAALADFRGHHSGSATASVAARLSAPAAALFARSEWKRRVVERRKSLWEAARKSLIWLSEHAGPHCEKAVRYGTLSERGRSPLGSSRTRQGRSCRRAQSRCAPWPASRGVLVAEPGAEHIPLG